MKANELLTAITMPLGLLLLGAALTLGCDNKEKVLDIEGPGGGEIEVERDRDTGALDVDARDGNDTIVDVNTPEGGVEVSRDDDGVGVDVDVDD
jgi:hypothetical protein